jgi:hypothetical protein
MSGDEFAALVLVAEDAKRAAENMIGEAAMIHRLVCELWEYRTEAGSDAD